MASVTVFTPKFQKQQVKISPNMTLLEILEEVCLKQDFDPNLYDLKHFRTILDLSQMFRFSGLPHNCELELILSTKPRKDDAEVVILVQLSDGTRCQGSFTSNTSLAAILEALCSEKAALELNPVIIYTRKEVFGDQLAGTTLKSLGLTSGKAMLRLVHKTPEELKVQANVSSALKTTKPSDTDEYKPRRIQQVETKTPVETITKQESSEVKEEEKMDVDNVVPGPSSAPESSASAPKEAKPKVPKKERKITKEEIEKLESETIPLDDKKTVIYSLDSVIRAFEDLPDDFFDVTVSDLHVLMRHLTDGKSTLTDAPLLTSKLRELEESKKTLRQLQYKTSVIRVQFPNRLVLQAVFNPIDTVDSIMAFVMTFLKSPDIKFHLFITPPKTILNPEDRLVEIHCVPQALFHFGLDDDEDGTEDFIKDEFIDKLSTAAAADFIVAKIRGRIVIGVEEEPEIGTALMGEDSMSGSAIETKKQRIVGTFKASSIGAEQKQLPKWFKAPK